MGEGTSLDRSVEPIFIQGILPRSGTNFLSDLLLLHPDCAPAVDPAREDLFLDRSDALATFVDDVLAGWDPRWGDVTEDVRRRLYAALGHGLVSFLQSDPERRLVSKSPSVRHLERFFRLFPKAHLLILVRDGRAVAQSAMDTFGWSLERAARDWAGAAEEIERFRRTHAGDRSRWELVRYEDLVADLERTITRVMRSVELDVSTYDLEAARRLPVRGSSFHLGAGRSAVHWDPVPRGSDFAPTERWREWGQESLDRFEWLAGAQLRAFGYPSAGGARRSFVATARHVGRDGAWAARRAFTRARATGATASRPMRRRLGLVR